MEENKLPPEEVPLIVKWREHLPHMINSTYLINNIPLRFIKYQVYADNDTVRLHTSARAFNVNSSDMPEILRHWIPLTDNEGVQAYDHIAAELGIMPVKDNPDLLPAANNNKPITPEEVFKSQFLLYMQEQVSDAKSMMGNLNNIVLQLKNLDGNLGQAYAGKAKQMISAINSMIQLKKTNLELYKEFRKIFSLDSEKGDTSPPPKSSNQDRSDKLLE